MLDNNLSDDEIYDLLSNQTRREAVRYFSQASDIVHPVEEIAGYLHDKTEETRDDIETRLHHVDLPKLEDSDIIMYEEDKGIATYLGNEDLEESLEALE